MKYRVLGGLIHKFNDWFDETTPRFQIVIVLAGIFSGIFTALLFLQPVFSSLPRMPAERGLQKTSPNIIFIVADALSASDMSMFGYSLPTTPNLERITLEWTVYSNAQSPLTCTAAALPTFVTGRYTVTNNFQYYGDRINNQPGWLSIPNALEQNGYQTWWSGYHTPGFYHMGQVFQKHVCRAEEKVFVSISNSWFKARAISNSSFPFIPFTLDQMGIVQSGRMDFDRCTELDPLGDLLKGKKVTPPFSIYYHYSGVHGFPYPSGESLGEFLPLSGGVISQSEQRQVYGAYKTEDQPIVDKLRLRYDEAIADQDQKLANFIELLKQLDLYDSAMIIITSDHGQSFANGFTTHCTPLVSNAEAHVPLFVKYPYQTEGERFDFLVSTIDIAPTILDVAGLEYPENWFDGISLLKQSSLEAAKRIVFTRRYNYYSKLIPSEIAATDGKFRLVMRAGKYFLFDVLNDKLEMVNLLEREGYENDPQVQRLQQALLDYQKRAQFILDGGEILSAPSIDAKVYDIP